MNDSNSNPEQPTALGVDSPITPPTGTHDELLLEPHTGPDNNEINSGTPYVSMPDDKPAEEIDSGFSELGHTDMSEISSDVSNSDTSTPETDTLHTYGDTPITAVETSSDSSSSEVSAQNETSETPSPTLASRFDEHRELQEQHNVFAYVNIVAEHAKAARIESGWIENPDGSKGDPFAKVILSVDHDEIMEFISKYGTNFSLGLPSKYRLSAEVSIEGSDFAVNEITVKVPLSGRAADNFFREEKTNPIVTRAFDEAFAKEADENRNRLNDPEQQ